MNKCWVCEKEFTFLNHDLDICMECLHRIAEVNKLVMTDLLPGEYEYESLEDLERSQNGKINIDKEDK